MMYVLNFVSKFFLSLIIFILSFVVINIFLTRSMIFQTTLGPCPGGCPEGAFCDCSWYIFFGHLIPPPYTLLITVVQLVLSLLVTLIISALLFRFIKYIKHERI